MTTVAVLIPSTGRAAQMYDRVGRLLRQVPPDGACLAVVLSVPAHDQLTLQMATRLQMEAIAKGAELHVTERHDEKTAVDGWVMAYEYANHHGADWFVLGADDIEWDAYWLYHALKTAQETGALVIGLDDGGHTNINDYAPHYMMCRAHADEYGFIPDGYKAWWFDREVCQRARQLGVYAPAHNALAEHMHPDWGTNERDATHAAGAVYHDADKRLYEQRRRNNWK